MEENSRSKQPSTAKATERQKEIELQGIEIRESKRKSAKLKEIVSKEESCLDFAEYLSIKLLK